MASTFSLTVPLNNSCEALIASSGNSTLPLIGNTDIAGIGVIISFILSAYVVLTAAIFCWLFNLLPSNVLSAYDTEFCKRKTQHGSKNPAYNAFFRTLAVGVLAFSDIQILQGIAIFIAAFANISTMTVFDWQIVVYLGWMSSNVHLTTLLFMQDYLHRQPLILQIRVLGMLILLTLLLVAFIPTSTWNWVLAVTRVYDRQNYPSDGGDDFYALNYAMPSLCFWHNPFNGRGENVIGLSRRVNPDAPFTYLALLITYAWRIFMLGHGRRNQIKTDEEESSNNATPWNSTYRRRVEFYFQMLLQRFYATQAKKVAREIETYALEDAHNKFSFRKTWLNLRFRFWCILYATTLALFDFFRSFVASLWILLLLLLWGTFEVANVRSKALASVQSTLNQWQFGQILPMILLGVPALAIAQHFMRDREDNEKPERQLTILLIAVQEGRKEFLEWCKITRSKLNPHQILNRLKRYQKPHHTLDNREAKFEDDSGDVEESQPLINFFKDLDSLDEAAAVDLSLNYFYKDKLFKTLLIFPNLMALAGGVVALWLEGRSVVQNGQQLSDEGRSSVRDPKGDVFEYIGIILAASAAAWIVWSALVMACCRLFEVPTSWLNHPKEEDEPLNKRSATEPVLPSENIATTLQIPLGERGLTRHSF